MTSIKGRLTFTYALAVTATLAASLGVGGWLLHGQMIRGLELLHAAEFEEIRGRLGADSVGLDSTGLAARVREHTDIDAALYYFQIHDPEGRALFRSNNLGAAILPDLGDVERHWSVDVPPLGRLHLSEFRTGRWHVQIASALEPVQRLMRDYWRVSSLLVAAVALASVGLGYAFSRYALRPTATIARTAHRIDADNLGERIPVPAGGSELADLARLLNRMFDRLEASFAHARRFSADVSHELKTPLSLVRLNAEKLRPSLAADTEASARLDDLIEETGRLHTIIERLLFIAKAESGTLTLARQARDAQAVVAGFAEDAQALAEDAGVRFELAANDPGPVHCDPGLVRQLLLNLLTNALKVSPPGGVVALASRTAGGWWQLEVSDSGPGLPPGELERVFQRFVRYHRPGGPPPEPGHGLGLAICRSIAELHHGRIRAENRPGGGLSVIVEIPASS